MANKVDLPDLSNQPWSLQQAMLILREQLEVGLNRVEAVETWRATQPPILSLEEIRQQLGPMGATPLLTAGLLNTTPADTNTPEIPPVEDGIPDYLDIVTTVRNAMAIGPDSTAEEVFNFMRQVAADINASGQNPSGIVCGFADAPAVGDNVFTCQGETYRYNRVCFSNGHLFKILIDSDPGGSRLPTWDSNGLAPDLYREATTPGSPC